MIDKNRVISLLLILVMFLSIVPIEVFASGNNASLPSNPKTGSGETAWRYWTSDNEALRYSILWAPSEEDFVLGNEKIIQIGEVTDISRTGLKYRVERYTTQSIYDYMNPGRNKDGILKYSPTYDEDIPYDWVGPAQSSLIAQMPKVFRSTPTEALKGQQEWREFFHGPYVDGEPTYKNIEELARLAGASLTKEDYMRGYYDINGSKVKGIYKIYAEPLINMVADNYGTVATFKDLIRQNEDLPSEDDKSILGWLTPTFVHTANSMVLIEPEASLGMIANNGKPLTYDTATKQRDREEIRRQIAPNGHAYLSMGVGVFSSPNDVPQVEVPQVEVTPVPEDVSYVVETYVKIIGVNPDGSLKYQEIKPAEKVEAELDEKGALKIEEIKEIEEGTAYLNDIIVSPKNLLDSDSDISWVEGLPQSSKDKIEPTSQDISKYLLGKITGVINYILDCAEVPKEITIGGGRKLQTIEELRAMSDDLKAGKPVSNDKLYKAFLQISGEYNLGNLNLEPASPEFKQALVDMSLDKAIKAYNSLNVGSKSTSTETFYNEAVLITDLDEVYLDNTHPNETTEVEIEIAQPKSSNSNEDIVVIEEKNNKAENIENSSKEVVYLRYVVIPTREEVSFIEVYKDGVLVDKQRTVKELPMVEVNGKYEPETYMTDLRVEGKELVSWGTSKDTPLLDTMPSSPIKSGITYEPIVGLESDENIYVTWKTETFTGAASNNFLVDEWRLSKYTDNIGFNSKAYMGLTLRADKGHATSTLSPSGKYNYDTVNPNGLVTDKNYNPLNMNYNSHLHSKAITQGSYSISHGSPSVFVDVTGNINLIKSTALSGLRVASWTADSQTESDLKLHNLEVSSKGVTYSGANVINKSDLLKYGIKNKDTYTHNYGKRYHYTCHHYDNEGRHSGCHDVCSCYTLPETPSATYSTSDYKVDSTFERYKGVNTDDRLFKLANVESKVDNGKTTYTEQSSSVLNLYPEIPMLFDNDAGNPSIKYVVGEEVRKVQPITYHTMEYTAYVKDVKATGMSVATDSRAKVKANQIGLGGNPVVHKGSGINISAEVKLNNSSAEQGILTVKTYALDVSSKVKNDWGNASYNTSTINDTFLSKFGSKQGGKWVFPAKANERLFVASSPAFEGISKINDIKYNEKSKSDKEYKLTVRGGVLTHVDGTAISTIKTSNPDLYEALVAMRLVGTDKNTTILATFEHQTGKALTEQKFIDLAKSARGVDNLELGKGWYSEDSTVLIIKEYTTVLNLPNVVFTDKIPMTVSGLQTPMNKQQFYSVIAKGHNIINYEVGGSIKAYFEHNTSSESPFGSKITSYGVPNVSISDTMGLN